MTSSSKARKRRPHEQRQRTTGFLLTIPALPMTVRPALDCPIVLQLIDGNGIPRPRGLPISDVGMLAPWMAASLQSGHSIVSEDPFRFCSSLSLRYAAMTSSVSSLCRFRSLSVLFLATSCWISRRRPVIFSCELEEEPFALSRKHLIRADPPAIGVYRVIRPLWSARYTHPSSAGLKPLPQSRPASGSRPCSR